jgi:hypothetical protein
MKDWQWLKLWKETPDYSFESMLPKLTELSLNSFLGLNLTPHKTTILFPLCCNDKSIYHLAKMGYSIVGIEISKNAIYEFFRQNNIHYSLVRKNNIDVFVASNPKYKISIYCEDIFNVHEVFECNALYDSAALFALPPNVRSEYVCKITNLLSKNFKGILIALQHDQPNRTSPPYHIPTSEIDRYSNYFSIDKADTFSVKVTNTHKQNNFCEMSYLIYRLSN